LYLRCCQKSIAREQLAAEAFLASRREHACSGLYKHLHNSYPAPAFQRSARLLVKCYRVKNNSWSVAAAVTGCFCTFFKNSLINFFPVYLDFWWCLDPDTYLISFHAQYCNDDIVTNDKFFPDTPCQNEHN